MVGDEARFFPYKKVTDELMPALSGQTHPLGNVNCTDYNPLYKSTRFLSDSSLTTKGSWLEREEEKLGPTRQTGKRQGNSHRGVQKP